MRQGKRFGLSAAQKSDVWRRWKAGQTLHEIGRVFGKEHSSIRCLVSRHGGVCSGGPAALAPEGSLPGSSIREIARRLDRVASTVSREVARHW
jgi:hypothetical protein